MAGLCHGLLLTRYTQPEAELQLLVQQLGTGGMPM
jgi:hypothetical protein